jgi:hypothetical protein
MYQRRMKHLVRINASLQTSHLFQLIKPNRQSLQLQPPKPPHTSSTHYTVTGRIPYLPNDPRRRHCHMLRVELTLGEDCKRHYLDSLKC